MIHFRIVDSNGFIKYNSKNQGNCNGYSSLFTIHSIASAIIQDYSKGINEYSIQVNNGDTRWSTLGESFTSKDIESGKVSFR